MTEWIPKRVHGSMYQHTFIQHQGSHVQEHNYVCAFVTRKGVAVSAVALSSYMDSCTEKSIVLN